MQQRSALVASELVSQGAPRHSQPPLLAVGAENVRATFGVEAVKAEGGDARFGRGLADGLLERLDGGQLRQGVGTGDKVTERNEGMRFAAAVSEGKLADGLVIFASEPERHLAHEVAEIVGWVRESKKLLGLFVNRPLARLHHDFVKVGGELLQRKFTRCEVGAEGYDFVPRFPG